MKILLIINSSNNGGAPKMIIKLYQEIVKRFPKSKLIFLQKIESQYSAIPNALYLSDRLKYPQDYWKVSKKLFKIIKDEKPNATISFLPLSNILTACISKYLNVPVRIASQRNPPYIYGRIVRAIDRYIGSNNFYTHNVCNSKAGKEAFSNYPVSYKNLLSVINNCVEEADLSVTKDEARVELGITNSKKIITCVGRLHDQKNHEVIIRAMKHVDNAILYLAGDGPLRKSISNLIANNKVQEKVVLMGDLERVQVQRLLRASDVFIIPSKYEGLSNSLIEALSYGLPVIFSNIPSFTSFLKVPDNKYAGILVNDNQSAKYAGAINDLIQNEEQMEYYQSLSRDKVKDLTASNMANKFMNLIIN